MKFVIEVDDFYLDEEELSEALKQQVSSRVITEIMKRIEARVEEAITTRVKATIDTKIAPIIEEKLNEFVKTGMIMVDKKEVSITDHLRKIFESNHGWSSPRDQVANLAEKFGKELRQRYDAVFANRIVVKINEQGLLKDEVVKLLMQ